MFILKPAAALIAFLATTLVHCAPATGTTVDPSYVPPPGAVYVSDGVYFIPFNSTSDRSPSTLPANNYQCVRSTDIENQVSAGSPTVSDCNQLCANIATYGFWKVIVGSPQRRIADFETCAFGVTVGTSTVIIGNEDIRQAIYDSIDMYKHNFDGVDRVGSKGSWQCNKPNSSGKGTIRWGLYKRTPIFRLKGEAPPFA